MEVIAIILLLTVITVINLALIGRVQHLERQISFLHENVRYRDLYENLPVSGDYSEIGRDQNGKVYLKEDQELKGNYTKS